MGCELYLNPGIIIVNHVGNQAFNFTLVRHLRILWVKGKLCKWWGEADSLLGFKGKQQSKLVSYQDTPESVVLFDCEVKQRRNFEELEVFT